MLLDIAIANAINTADLPNWFVVCLGLAIVFFGLIVIILLISIVGKVINLLVKDAPAKPAAAAPAVAAASAEIPNRPEFVAAVSAAIAEELGTDITKIRIVSIKKL